MSCYTSIAGANAEPYIIIGYPEMCFNIAEAVNPGWVTGNVATWYNNGINASLSWFGLSQSDAFTVGNVSGTVLGTVMVDVSFF
ncbi:MAG: SusD/RagB family nutrient-binding outer membrane lipoprotein [Bacteroidota bacterium]|nr:SusD/RagB family nutrient-binding outer membrane lipoprotein [Bacteroidota bacterium]